MNTDTGQIRNFTDDEWQQLKASMESSRWKPVDPANLSKSKRERLAKYGFAELSRNSSCPCGSHKRFKRCCFTGAK